MISSYESPPQPQEWQCSKPLMRSSEQLGIRSSWTGHKIRWEAREGLYSMP